MIRSMYMSSVNPFKWISEMLDRVDELEETVLVLYCVGVLLVGIATQAYEDASSLVILAVVGSITAIPFSLLMAAVLRFLSELYEKLS